MQRFKLRLLLLSALVLIPLAASAQTIYPSQPIKVIVPFPPGGGTDLVGRLITAKVHAATKWTFVVDNKAGAGGNIGMDAVAKSKPDGYTLALGQTANLAINPALYPKMPYEAAKDFSPIALVAGQPVVLVVNASSPYKSVADLVAAGKSKPGSLTMGSAGTGTVGHLTGELFAKQAGFTHVHVPYKGAAPAITDLMGGQVDYYYATPQSVANFVKSGKIRALAVSSAKRIEIFANTPTIAESGFKGFETNDWKMLVGPKGMSAELVAKLNSEVQKAVAIPETVKQLQAEGSVPMSGSPQQVTQFLQDEQKRWAAVVHDGNIKPE